MSWALMSFPSQTVLQWFCVKGDHNHSVIAWSIGVFWTSGWFVKRREFLTPGPWRSETFLPELQTNLRKLERWWGSDCCLEVFNFSFSCISSAKTLLVSLSWIMCHPNTSWSCGIYWIFLLPFLGLLIYCPNVTDSKPGCSTCHITKEDAPSPWSPRDWWIRIQEGWVDFEDFFPINIQNEDEVLREWKKCIFSGQECC